MAYATVDIKVLDNYTAPLEFNKLIESYDIDINNGSRVQFPLVTQDFNGSNYKVNASVSDSFGKTANVSVV